MTGLDVAIESDRAYFEMGAKTQELGSGRIAWLAGLEQCMAAVVVHRIDAQAAAASADRWIAEVEAGLAQIGAPVSRIYLDGADSPLDTALRKAGYVAQAELAFVGNPRSIGEPALRFRPVESEADWADKLQFHRRNADRPDGHSADAWQWVRIERARCEAGSMRAWLCECDGKIVGAIGTIDMGRLVRLKNVVVDSAWRSRGVGSAMVAQASALVAAGRGVCVFAVAGHPGEKLYRAAGLSVAGCQVEWSRPI